MAGLVPGPEGAVAQAAQTGALPHAAELAAWSNGRGAQPLVQECTLHGCRAAAPITHAAYTPAKHPAVLATSYDNTARLIDGLRCLADWARGLNPSAAKLIPELPLLPAASWRHAAELLNICSWS